MKKRVIFWALLSMGAVMTSCEQGRIVPEASNKDNFTLTINAAVSADDVKGHMTPINVYVFENGEEISVVNTTTGMYLGNLVAKNPQGAEFLTRMEKVTFSGTLIGAVTEGDELAYIYPATTDQTPGDTFEPYTVDFSAQEYNSSSASEVPFSAMFTEKSSFASTDPEVVDKGIKYFQPQTAYLKLSLFGMPEGVKIQSLALESIGTGLEWTVEGGTIKANTVEENAGTITLNVAGRTSASSTAGARTLYLEVPVSAESASRRPVSVTMEGGAVYEGEFSNSAIAANANLNTIIRLTLVENVELTITEADDKGTDTYITNTGALAAYVRAIVIANHVDADGNITAGAEFSFTSGSKWTKNGLFYYYSEPLAIGDSTEKLIDGQITVTDGVEGDIQLTIIAQGSVESWN